MVRFVVLADQIAGALALRMEEEAAAAAKMLQYSVPAEPSLVSQGYTNDVSRAPTDYGTQCTRNTVPDGGEELHGIRGSSPSGASQHAGQVEPVQLGSATEKASTNIFLRFAFPTSIRLTSSLPWMVGMHTQKTRTQTHTHRERHANTCACRHARRHMHALATDICAPSTPLALPVPRYSCSMGWCSQGEVKVCAVLTCLGVCRAPLASKANWKENRGPDSRMKDATKETVAAKRKGTNPFALPPAKTVKQ